jgi:hypothetical protein
MKLFRVLTQEEWGPPPVSRWTTVQAENLARVKKLPGKIVIDAYEIEAP